MGSFLSWWPKPIPTINEAVSPPQLWNLRNPGIGDLDFCTIYISHKHSLAKQLILQLEEVGVHDPQVALILLRTCSGFCKLAHLAWATPPSLSLKALELFHIDVRNCMSQSTSVDMTDLSWKQAQLSLSRGGLDLHSLMLHAPAAYIASVCLSGYGHQSLTHLAHAMEIFNSCVAPSEKISLDSILSSPMRQKTLSSKLDDLQFHSCITCPQWLIGHAYYPSLPLILHHGFQLSPQKVLASTLNQINTMLLSNGGLA